MAILELEGVRKSFWIPSIRRETLREHVFSFFRPTGLDELRVLESVSFAVERGESFGVMGRNGSGKSTMLRLMAGIYRPDAGEVRVNGSITPVLGLGVGWNPELNAIDNTYLFGTALG